MVKEKCSTLSLRHVRERRVPASSARRGKHRRRCGAASVEAVIVLPFFILILAGVLFVHHLWEAKQMALIKARQCAWRYSNSGCDEAPPGCDGSVDSTHAQESDNEVTDALEGGVLDELGGIPFIGIAIRSLFGTALDARASRQTSRPPPLGGGRVPVAAHYYLMCNEQPQTPSQLIRNSFCALLNAVTGDRTFPGC